MTCHFLLFALPYSKIAPADLPSTELTTLRVTMLTETQKPVEETPKELMEQESTEPVVEISKKTEQLDQPHSKPLPDEKLLLQKSSPTAYRLSNKTINKFANRITGEVLKQNPSQLDEFDASFEQKLNKVETLELENREALNQLASTGVGKTINPDGSHTCFAMVYDLLAGQGLGDQIVRADCTPKQKFDLDLNKPNNGFMVR